MLKITHKEPQAAFEAAIKSGRLSRTPATPNYSGDYMYMGTYGGGDLFKNIITRAYLPQSALDAAQKLAAGTPAILAATTASPAAGNTNARPEPTKSRKTCACCGGEAYGAQWWNRDTGYGICAKCVDWQLSRKTSPAEILNLYGVEGINWTR